MITETVVLFQSPLLSSFSFLECRITTGNYKKWPLVVITARLYQRRLRLTVWLDVLFGRKNVVERGVYCFLVNALPFFKFLSQCSQLPVYNPLACENIRFSSLFAAGDVSPQADHPLLVGAVVDRNLSNDLLFFIEGIHMNNTVAIICSKMQNLKHIFQ